MDKGRSLNLALYILVMAALVGWLGWGKPGKVIGLFLVSGLAVGSLYALGGIGMVVLYRATGVLNLANGAAGAAGVMVAWQLGQWGTWEPATWAACILVALAISLACGRLIAPLLARQDPVVKAVATLGYALIILGLVSFAWIDDPRKITLPTDKTGVFILGLRVTVTRLIAFAASIDIVVAIWACLGRTVVRLQMRALANDRDLPALIGIPILRVETIARGLSGVIAGFTGLMFGDLIRPDPAVITFMVIASIATAVCGRLESMVLVLLGGLSIGVIESLLTLSPTFKGACTVAPFVIAALVLSWTRRGTRLTFGTRGPGR